MDVPRSGRPYAAAWSWLAGRPPGPPAGRDALTGGAAHMAVETAASDPAKAEAFAGRAFGILNDAFLALGMSVGHQTGLFDTLASLPPSTSEEIAAATSLDERYVREWLGAMTV